jgi:hypothetical protein
VDGERGEYLTWMLRMAPRTTFHDRKIGLDTRISWKQCKVNLLRHDFVVADLSG